jgi:hypothetical protein
MKWSLIITGFLCIALGGSFSIINKKEQQNAKSSLCCNKACEGQVKKQQQSAVIAEPYIPMVNILGYN